MDNNVRGGKGSLSAILTADNKLGDELTPQVTPYSNNLKHLNSLAKTISFPLTFKHSSSSKTSFHENSQDLPSLRHCVLSIRSKINDYLIEKKETDLKRQLYKSDMIDSPWDYYKLLDAQWIWLNIDLELEAHWKYHASKPLRNIRSIFRKNIYKLESNLYNPLLSLPSFKDFLVPSKKIISNDLCIYG